MDHTNVQLHASDPIFPSDSPIVLYHLKALDSSGKKRINVYAACIASVSPHTLTPLVWFSLWLAGENHENREGGASPFGILSPIIRPII